MTAPLDLSRVRKIAHALGLDWAWVDHSSGRPALQITGAALQITVGTWRVLVFATDGGVIWWDASDTDDADHVLSGGWYCMGDVTHCLTNLMD